MKYSALMRILVSTTLVLGVGTSSAMEAEAAIASSPTEQALLHAVELYKRKEYKAALDILTPLAAQGVAKAQYSLGAAYANGAGLPKNPILGAEWLSKAAAQGLPAAQVSLGLFYARGIGVGIDPSRAVEWYRKAADQGAAAGEYHLGLMYADGTGVPKDSAQAVAWYRKASAQGDAVGQFLLGNAYMTGVGVRKDLDQAIYLFQKSAKQGNEDAKVLAEAVATLKLGQAELVRRGVDPRTFQ